MSVKALNLHTKVVMKTRRPTLSAVPSAFHSDMAHEEAQAAPLAALQSRPEANPAPLEDLFFVNAENENVAGPKHLMSSKELSRLAKRSTQELKRWCFGLIALLELCVYMTAALSGLCTGFFLAFCRLSSSFSAGSHSGTRSK